MKAVRAIALLSFFALLAFSFRSRAQCEALFKNLSVPILWMVFVFWIWALIPRLSKSLLRNAMIPLALSVLVFTLIPPYFRTLSDETNLLAISKSIFESNSILNILSEYWLVDHRTILHFLVPDRPLIFPFLIQILHRLFGFDASNPFRLNFWVLVLVLTLLYDTSKKLSGDLGGLICVMVALCFPTILLYATSGNFDLMHAGVFLWIHVLLYRSLKDDRFLPLFWMTLILFCHIRPESIALLCLMIAILGLTRAVNLGALRKHWLILSLSPVMLLPILWQHLLFFGRHRNGAIPLFSQSLAITHARQYFESLFSFTYASSTALINLALVLLAGMILIVLWRQKRFKGFDRTLKTTAITAAISSLSFLAIYLSHFRGEPNHPTQARYFLIFTLLSAFIPAVLSWRFPSRILQAIVLALTVVAFGTQLTKAIFDHPILDNPMYRRVKFEIALVQSLATPKTLVISERPGHFATLGLFALHPHNANQLILEIRRALEHGNYDQILAFQQLDPDTQKPFSGEELDPTFQKLQIGELHFADRHRLVAWRIPTL